MPKLGAQTIFEPWGIASDLALTGVKAGAAWAAATVAGAVKGAATAGGGATAMRGRDDCEL